MRRRRRVEEHASHDRWLVSYADFITLLFAFFVVLFASAFRDNRAIVTVSHAIHQGFESMGAFTGENVAVYSLTPPDAETLKKQNLPAGSPVTRTVSTPDLIALRKQLQSAMGAELQSHEVELRVTPEGFVISLKELGFFDSGQAQLLPGAAQKIRKIAEILSQHNLDLRVEGHSDDQPIHNAAFRSNWELSTERAMTVLELLVGEAGFNPQKISVAGYGQYHPIADNATAEGRRINRRVDLVVVGATPPQMATAPTPSGIAH
ncbi:MAG TPA: OmpA family protein [Acidobacteriaceae bacterium]|nr:OmpA family protein [Acidobacteriaceae bacterium]